MDVPLIASLRTELFAHTTRLCFGNPQGLARTTVPMLCFRCAYLPVKSWGPSSMSKIQLRHEVLLQMLFRACQCLQSTSHCVVTLAIVNSSQHC